MSRQFVVFVGVVVIIAIATAVNVRTTTCSTLLHHGCPTLTRLLDFTNDEQDATIVNDISIVLDRKCCQDLQGLQQQRCFCDDMFMSRLTSAKSLDDFTLFLFAQSVQFECEFDIQYGPDCSTPETQQLAKQPLIYSNPINPCSQYPPSNFRNEEKQDNISTSLTFSPPSRQKQLLQKIPSNDVFTVSYINLFPKEEEGMRSEQKPPTVETQEYALLTYSTYFNQEYASRTSDVDTLYFSNFSNVITNLNNSSKQNQQSFANLSLSIPSSTTKSLDNWNDIQHNSNYNHIYNDGYNYGDEEVFRKGDLVFKSADEEEGELKKQPYILSPKVEELFYSEAVSAYIDWAVNVQQQKQDNSSSVIQEQEQSPEGEIQWQYRGVHRVCKSSVLLDINDYKEVSIVGQCLRQHQKNIATEDHIVIVAPKNPGFLKWLRLDMNKTLIQFFSDNEQMKEVIGRHVAVGQTLNTKIMLDGEVVSLQSIQGTLLTISLNNSKFLVNGIEASIVHSSCDGVILVVPTPIPIPSIQTHTQQPQITSGLESLIPLLIFPNESASPAEQPKFKFTSSVEDSIPQIAIDEGLTEWQGNEQQSELRQRQDQQICGAENNLLKLVKDQFPGFAYLASYQGFVDILESGSDVTVFVPGALGGGIQVDDYIMGQTLHEKDIAWLGSGAILVMISGNNQEIQYTVNGEVLIGGRHVRTWDNTTCNGVMHVLEGQFQRPSQAAQNDFNSSPGQFHISPSFQNSSPLSETPIMEEPIIEQPTIEQPFLNFLPPPPLTLNLGDDLSLIRVDPPNSSMSSEQIYSLVTNMMSQP